MEEHFRRIQKQCYGILMFLSNEQPLKAPSSILITLSGIIIFACDFENAYSPISLILFGIVIFISD